MADSNAPHPDWWIFRPGDTKHNDVTKLPPAPAWRSFSATSEEERGKGFRIDPKQLDVINAAIYLRRPLLVKGKPGVGKTTLAYAIARQLKLPPVLRWSITSRTTLKEGLYSYDAIGRLQELQESSIARAARSADDNETIEPPPIERFMKLGPVGTALGDSQPKRPRVLLIDELDKCDIDLPNDLLHIFEEGEFVIEELERMTNRNRVPLPLYGDQRSGPPVEVEQGRVHCREFPIVVMTSNDERDFPPAFRRRCLELDIEPPQKDDLTAVVKHHFVKEFSDHPDSRANIDKLITAFLEKRTENHNQLATDQLLHAFFLTLHGVDVYQRLQEGTGEQDSARDKDDLIERLWQPNA